MFRLSLLLGLILHKLLWEVLKRRDQAARPGKSSSNKAYAGMTKSVKGLVLTFLAVQTLFLDLVPIAEHPTPLRVVGTLIYVAGFAIAVAGRLQLGRNWVDLEDFQVLPEQALVTHGIYRYIRHPIYTGDVLLLVGLQLALNSWLVLGIVVPLLVIIKQALAEEALLSRAFPAYSTYGSQTKRFIPFVV
jgi:protein-S-isoprenylcysteine O-methyltransferase Ste14